MFILLVGLPGLGYRPTCAITVYR